MKFVVIGVNPSTKIIQLSDLPHLMGEKPSASPVDDRFQMEEMIKLNVEWVLTGSNHVVFKTPKQAENKGENAAEAEAEVKVVTRGFFNEPVRNPGKFAASKKVCFPLSLDIDDDGDDDDDDDDEDDDDEEDDSDY